MRGAFFQPAASLARGKSQCVFCTGLITIEKTPIQGAGVVFTQFFGQLYQRGRRMSIAAQAVATAVKPA
ncbi:hypothetical protein KCP77_08295 [Salmonella enterica subsp. enterica]|nr:hypothetical protein KCP77_08295 [Salmonella enterica subsp. enterica]